MIQPPNLPNKASPHLQSIRQTMVKKDDHSKCSSTLSFSVHIMMTKNRGYLLRGYGMGADTYSSPIFQHTAALLVLTSRFIVSPYITFRPFLRPYPFSQTQPVYELQVNASLFLKGLFTPNIARVAIPVNILEYLVLTCLIAQTVVELRGMGSILMKLRHWLSGSTQVTVMVLEAMVSKELLCGLMGWLRQGKDWCAFQGRDDEVQRLLVVGLGYWRNSQMIESSSFCQLSAIFKASASNLEMSPVACFDNLSLIQLRISVSSFINPPSISFLFFVIQMAQIILPYLRSSARVLNLSKLASFLMTMSLMSLASISSIWLKSLLCSAALSLSCLVSSSRWNLLAWNQCSLEQLGQNLLSQRRKCQLSMQALERQMQAARFIELHCSSGSAISNIQLGLRLSSLELRMLEALNWMRQGILEKAYWDRFISERRQSESGAWGGSKGSDSFFFQMAEQVPISAKLYSCILFGMLFKGYRPSWVGCWEF